MVKGWKRTKSRDRPEADVSRSFIAGAATGLALSILGLASVSLMVAPPKGGVVSGDMPVVEAPAAATTAPATTPDQSAASQTAASPSAETPPAVAAPAEPKPDATAQAPATPAPAVATQPPVVADAPQPPPAPVPTVPDVQAALPAPDQSPAATPTPVTPAPSAEPAPVIAATAPPAPTGTTTAPAQAAPAPAPEPAPAVAPGTDNAAAVGRVVVQPSAESPDPSLAVAAGAGIEAPPSVPPDEPETTPSKAASAEPVPGAAAPAETPTAKAQPTILAPPGSAKLSVQDAPAAGPLVLKPAGGGSPSTKLPRVVTLVPPAGSAAAPEAPAALIPAPAPGDASATPPDAAAGAGGAAPEAGVAGRVVPGVTILRLPGTSGTGTANAGPDKGAQAAAEAGPLRQYAASFTNPDNKPLLGILIFDQGVDGGGLDPAALASLPFPVTIAVDPQRGDASAVAASYHAAGAEVAILAGDLPDGSTASDVEVAYQAFTAALPDSVALVGKPGSPMVTGGLAAEHIAALLAADGRGLITYDAGLNDGRRAATKAGLPNAVIDKVLAVTDDNSGTVGRELDRAAFMAAQKGAAVIALPSTPEAVTSLVAWATGPSAKSVAVAPVSAVMVKGK